MQIINLNVKILCLYLLRMAPFVYTSDKLNSSFNKTFVGKTFVAATLQITPGYFTQQYKKKKSDFANMSLS